MNERIKELAKEAALVYKIIPPPATHTTPLYLIDNFKKNEGPAGIKIISDGFCEKFAELIVRECIAHVGEFTGEQNIEPVVLADGTRGYDYDTVSAEEVLRKHFGLE